MNTMVHIAAMVALLWAAVSFSFNTLQETELGYAVLALFFAWIPLTIFAAADDVKEAGRVFGK